MVTMSLGTRAFSGRDISPPPNLDCGPASRLGLEIQGQLHERNLPVRLGLSVRRGRLVQPAQL